MSHALVNVARDDWMSLENSHLETPLDEATSYSPPPAFEKSVRCRAIYETSVLDSTIGARNVEELINQGEEARLVPRIGMKMKLADESMAMLPLTPTGMEGAMIIRSAVIAGALREYFELLWERAMPVGTPAGLGDRIAPGGRTDPSAARPRTYRRSHRQPSEGEPADRAASARQPEEASRRRHPDRHRCGRHAPRLDSVTRAAGPARPTPWMVMLDLNAFVPKARFQPGVALSPDATEVAYSSNISSRFALWIAPVRGGEPRCLVDLPDQAVRQIAWAPDGDSLVFAADRNGDEQYQIYQIHLSTAFQRSFVVLPSATSSTSISTSSLRCLFHTCRPV
jgi:hypothetical protein